MTAKVPPYTKTWLFLKPFIWVWWSPVLLISRDGFSGNTRSRKNSPRKSDMVGIVLCISCSHLANDILFLRKLLYLVASMQFLWEYPCLWLIKQMISWETKGKVKRQGRKRWGNMQNTKKKKKTRNSLSTNSSYKSVPLWSPRCFLSLVPGFYAKKLLKKLFDIDDSLWAVRLLLLLRGYFWELSRRFWSGKRGQ